MEDQALPTRLLAIASAMTMAAPIALAADLPLPPANPPAFTWTGFYLGVNGGYITKHDRLDGTVPDLNVVLPGAANVAVRQFSDSGAGGGQVGYTYQVGAGRGGNGGRLGRSTIPVASASTLASG